MARLVPLLVTLALAVVIASPASAAPGPPVATCWVPGATAGQACTGWFTTNVTVRWEWDPGETATACNVVTITADTAGTAVNCTVWYGEDYVAAGRVIRRDATAPVVTGAATERGPDAGEWFNRPVAVTFTGTDATSGIAACSGGTYAGPDSAGAGVGGSCRDVAGNTSSGSFTLRYDATPPAATATAARAPDANGWYRAPVDVRFTGTDALSGVASCDKPVTFKGPDTARTTVAGSCRDAAGNGSGPAGLTLRYDSKPPAVAAALEADAGDGFARLRWKRAPSAQLVEIVRAPGLGGDARSVVYRGRAGSFLDRRVRNGVRYRYEVRSLDAAGNAAARTVVALPQPPVFAPARGATLQAAPRAAWAAVEGARFYNAQLYRGRVKLLSTWVVEPRLRVPLTWTFEGRRHALADGGYRLYVWPAFGTRAKPRYGRLLGETAFRVKLR